MREKNAQMVTFVNKFGESFGTLLSQQSSKFLLGEHVSMVYPQWRPLTTGGFPNLRLARCVEMKSKV